MRILIIEDDHLMASNLKKLLEKEKFSVDATSLGEEGLDLSKVYDYDLIVLDLNLPDVGGHEILERMRTKRITSPLLILSGIADLESKLQGFTLGADDYLTKPFESSEFLARVHALLRRSRGHSHSEITIGKLSLNLETKAILMDGKPVKLTVKEAQVLEYLCLHKGNVVTKDMFLDHIYSGDDEPEPKIINVFICKLRRKLADASGGEHYIENVWGRGYLIRDPATEKEEDQKSKAIGA